MNLTRYWFEFNYKHFNELPAGLTYGCGVTAFSYDDAIELIKKELFKNQPMVSIKKVTENIDVSTLDAGHVLPNMPVPPSVRGIWYPAGYTDYFTSHDR